MDRIANEPATDFPSDQAMAAYDTFKLASKHRALKVAIDF